MPNWNKVTLIGHMTRDVQTKALPSGTTVGEFGVAVSHKYKDKEETCFLDCAIFGKGAEVLAQYAGKGAPIFLSGRLKQDQWEDRNGGGKRSKISVVVEDFQFLGQRSGNGGQQQTHEADIDL